MQSSEIRDQRSVATAPVVGPTSDLQPLASAFHFQPAQTGGTLRTSELGASGSSTPARRFFSRRRATVRVQPATGLKHEMVSYIAPQGNVACGTCGAISTAAAPDFLLRQRRGWIWNFCLALARKRIHKRR